MTVLRIGTSGGTREDVAVGTLVISSYAIGLDSTGLYYEGPPADETVTALEHAARRAIEEGVRPARASRGPSFPTRPGRPRRSWPRSSARPRPQGARFVTGATVTAPGFFGPSGRHVDGLDEHGAAT